MTNTIHNPETGEHIGDSPGTVSTSLAYEAVLATLKPSGDTVEDTLRSRN